MKLWIGRLAALFCFAGLQFWLRGCFRLLDAAVCLLVALIIILATQPA